MNIYFYQGIKTESVLVGYKPYSDTNEEFLLCSTDKAKQFIQETQTQMEREFKQKVERSMFRVPGPWESKSSDKDVEEIKPVQTREKVCSCIIIIFIFIATLYYKKLKAIIKVLLITFAM